LRNGFRHPARHAGRVARLPRSFRKCGGSSISRLPARAPDRLRGLEAEVAALRDVVERFGVGPPEQRPHQSTTRSTSWKWRASRSRRGEAVRRSSARMRSVRLPDRPPRAEHRGLALRGRPEPLLRPARRAGRPVAPFASRAIRTGCSAGERFRARRRAVERTFRTMAWEGDPAALASACCPFSSRCGGAPIPRPWPTRSRRCGARAPRSRVRGVRLVRVRVAWRKGALAEGSRRGGDELAEPGRRGHLFWAIDRMRGRPLRCRDPAAAFSLLESGRSPCSRRTCGERRWGRTGDSFRAGSVLTHCNAAPSPPGDGTALGVIRSAIAAGKRIHVYVDRRGRSCSPADRWN